MSGTGVSALDCDSLVDLHDVLPRLNEKFLGIEAKIVRSCIRRQIEAGDLWLFLGESCGTTISAHLVGDAGQTTLLLKAARGNGFLRQPLEAVTKELGSAAWTHVVYLVDNNKQSQKVYVLCTSNDWLKRYCSVEAK